jgi:hypothetical protein
VRTLKTIAITALAFTAVPLATLVAGAGTSYADSVRFEVGNVAIGYNDGYWDRSHQWHNWQRQEDMTAYRSAKNAEYHDWRHDRDKDMGWHEPH